MRQYFMLFYSWGFTRKSPRDLQEVPDSYAKQSCGLTQGSSGLLHEAVLGSKHLLAQNSSRLYSQQSFGCVQSMPRVLLKAILSTSTEFNWSCSAVQIKRSFTVLEFELIPFWSWPLSYNWPVSCSFSKNMAF